MLRSSLDVGRLKNEISSALPSCPAAQGSQEPRLLRSMYRRGPELRFALSCQASICHSHPSLKSWPPAAPGKVVTELTRALWFPDPGCNGNPTCAPYLASGGVQARGVRFRIDRGNHGPSVPEVPHKDVTEQPIGPDPLPFGFVEPGPAVLSPGRIPQASSTRARGTASSSGSSG